MKFSQYLEKIAGVGVYPMISLLLFVFFFTVVTVLVFKQNQAEINHIENLPLDN
jgi:cytochrome c oxidase cbb3-type subunit 3